MTKSAWQRTGAFVGTVVTVVAADRIARHRSNDVVGAIGKSFSQSLGAAMGKDMSVAEYQRGGYPVIDGRTTNVLPPAKSVWQEGYELANEKFPHLAKETYWYPYLWRGIYYRLLSLFPQVTVPYVVDWPAIAERLSGVDASDDYELVAEVIAELWDRNGI